MTVFPLLAAGFLITVIAVIWFLCALILVLVVLIQKGKGGGLSGAIAGGAVGGILGAKSKEPLTWFTIFLVAIFLVFSVVLAKYYTPTVSDFDQAQTQPVTVPAGEPTSPEQPQGSAQPENLEQPGPAIEPEAGGMATDTNTLGD